MTLVAQDARRVATKGGTNLTSPTYFGQLSALISALRYYIKMVAECLTVRQSDTTSIPSTSLSADSHVVTLK